jgi:integrase
LVEQGHGDIRLAEIDVRMVTDYKEWRAGHPGVKPGTTLADQTLRNDVYALSGVLRRAWEEEIIEQNPVNRTRFRSKVERPPTYLEIEEGAALLQVARWFDFHRSGRGVPFLEALIGSMLIEGLRRSEAFHLQVGDIDLEAGILRVGRKLKTNHALRDVPLWPQFRQMVEPLLEQRRSEGYDALLFPSPDTGGVLTDIRGSLETAVEAAGIEKDITCHSLRHTYASVRIQTLEQGHPVSLFTVAREMGHGSTQLIEQRYGHILKNPRRLPHVAFDFEDPDGDE